MFSVFHTMRKQNCRDRKIVAEDPNCNGVITTPMYPGEPPAAAQEPIAPAILVPLSRALLDSGIAFTTARRVGCNGVRSIRISTAIPGAQSELDFNSDF